MTKKIKPYEIFTVGHSTKSLPELAGLLKSFGISHVADVRTIPRSRHNPQFNRRHLMKALAPYRIRYRHMAGLGGLRRARKDSANGAWRNASFRGFADYMQTREFVRNLQRLIRFARRRRVAVMCAEAVPWRCHRSLIADALTVRKFEVLHILGPHRAQPHRMTPWAKVRGVKIGYPATGDGKRVRNAPEAGTDGCCRKRRKMSAKRIVVPSLS